MLITGPALKSSVPFRPLPTDPRIKPGSFGPFRILQQYGPAAYQSKLPPHLSSTHDVFPQLRKCLRALGSSRDRSNPTWTKLDLSGMTHPKFRIRKNMLPDEELSNPIRYNGANIQQKKSRGRQRTIHKLTTLSFSTKEEIYTYSVKKMLCNF